MVCVISMNCSAGRLNNSPYIADNFKMLLIHGFTPRLLLLYSDCYFRLLNMCSTEEDDVLFRRGGELLEGEVEAESVVESVVRGEKDESGRGSVDEK